MICLFVKFYWALSHSRDDAIGILVPALMEQGFGLDDGDTLESTADLTKQVDPHRTSQIGDDASQSLSKEIPRCDIRFQKKLNANKDVPDCPKRQGKSSSQICLPSLDPTSLPARQIEFNPSSTLPDSRNTTAICDLPKKRRGRQINPDRRSIKHRKINEVTLDTSKLCNVSQMRNDDIDKETKARPSQREDIRDKADHDALCGQPPLKKVPGRLPCGLKFNKISSAKKDVPDYPERGENSSQTYPPSLDPTSLSASREIEVIPFTLPLPPDPQNTNDLRKPRKRQTSLDTTPRKKHRRIDETISDASNLRDNNNLKSHCSFGYREGKLNIIFRPVASSTSESTRIELDETANAPVPKIHDPQRDVETHPSQGKQNSRSNFRATKKTSVLAPPPKDTTLQPKQYETTSNPKKRRASNSESRQRKRQEVLVHQEDSVPVIVQPDLAKKKRGRHAKVKEEQEGSVSVQPAPRKEQGGRAPKVKEGQEGSTSLTVQSAPREKDRPLNSHWQAHLNAGRVVPFFGQNVDMTQKSFWIPAQSSYAVSGLPETAEGFRCHDYVPWSMLDRENGEINCSENWLCTQERVWVEEDSILDCENLAATKMEDRPTSNFPTHKPPLCVNPPIWAQVCDNTLRLNKLSSTFLSSHAKKFAKPLIGSGAIKVVFILHTMQ